MYKDDLEKRLKHAEIPSPSKDAVEKAVAAAMAEFQQRQETAEKKIKGFSRPGRQKAKKPKGGFIMIRKFAVTAVIFMGIVWVLATLYTPRYRFATLSLDPSEELKKNEFTGFAIKGSAPRKNDAVSSQPNRSARAIPPDQTYVGRDRFENAPMNPIHRVSEAPVSTFSIDVDTASYAFVRRALKNGYLPPKNAVRTEEMINYFHYDYALPPDPSVPFKPTVTVVPTPWNKDTRLIHIGIKGFDMVPEKKPKSNLVFLIDVSGSMNQPDKLPLLINAFGLLVNELAPDDRVGIVVYAGAAGTVLEPTLVKEKHKILEALEKLRAGGSTAGGAGIRLAYHLAEEHFDPKGINRIILATDGDFNVGIRDSETLKSFIERKRETGISLSVLGFGQGNYNDALMQKLAQNGNGNAAYIDSLSEARKVLVDEISSTLFTIAGDVKIQVEFNPERVAEYRLIGYETRQLRREDFKNDRVDAGDIGAGHSVTAIYEITPVESPVRFVDDLRYQQKSEPALDKTENMGDEYAFLKIRYKLPKQDKSKLLTDPIGKASEVPHIEDAGKDVRFSIAVAAFGQILRGDAFIKNFKYSKVLQLAQQAKGEDPFGYRSEFIQLVNLAEVAQAMGEK